MCRLCEYENERPESSYRPSEVGYDPYNSADVPYWSYAVAWYKS